MIYLEIQENIKNDIHEDVEKKSFEYLFNKENITDEYKKCEIVMFYMLNLDKMDIIKNFGQFRYIFNRWNFICQQLKQMGDNLQKDYVQFEKKTKNKQILIDYIKRHNYDLDKNLDELKKSMWK